MVRDVIWMSVAAGLLGTIVATGAEAPRVGGLDLSKLTVLRDVAYVPGGHERQKLDLYIPKEADPNGRRALLVWVHGGAWLGGSKERPPALRFAGRGYAVASLNYRLSQHAVFPAQIVDCKAAIRWLRANAGQYGYDPNRIGVWGASAGGHLVALLGTTGDIKEFDVGPNLGVSSRVQAVCDFFGPTDFAKMSDAVSSMNHSDPCSPESKLIGGPIQANQDKVQKANPITYVTKDDPPFLIVHGDSDPLVPHNQSELLRDALQKAGVDVTFYTVKGGGHGGFRDPQVNRLVTEFFQKQLRKR